MGALGIGSITLWTAFSAVILTLLFLDLGVFHRKAHEVRTREALTWTAIWIAAALAFDIGIWQFVGREKALEFLTGYVMEKALSVDNLFVFLVLFAYFSAPPPLHHRVLFWGILGALVIRGAFILLGVTLLQHAHWVMYILGAFLIIAAIRLARGGEQNVRPEKNLAIRFFKRFLPLVPDYRGSAFFTTEKGKFRATPLLLVLLAIEATDVAFAMDSIPAVFGVTKDPFIVYSSNVFAILGLRALYFALAGMMKRVVYLKAGLSLILGFVGAKMVISGVVPISTLISLLVIGSVLAATAALSFLVPPKTVSPPESQASCHTEQGPTVEPHQPIANAEVGVSSQQRKRSALSVP